MTSCMISELPSFESDAVEGGCGSHLTDRPVARPADWVIVFRSRKYGVNASPQGFLRPPHCIKILA